MRTFETGATRDTAEGKLDFEGFLSPLALLRYAEYMHEHRIQPDGELRPSDNWQKGMPREEYMKSLHRHFMDAWLVHRGLDDVAREDLETALCAVLFNTFGYLHELLVEKRRSAQGDVNDDAEEWSPRSRFAQNYMATVESARACAGGSSC